jgi:hypothetical protein
VTSVARKQIARRFLLAIGLLVPDPDVKDQLSEG